MIDIIVIDQEKLRNNQAKLIQETSVVDNV